MKKLEDRLYPKWRHAVRRTPSFVNTFTCFDCCVVSFAFVHKWDATKARAVRMHLFGAEPKPHVFLSTSALRTSHDSVAMKEADL